MQNYCVRLESPVSKSYRCQRAANSVDLDIHKKSIHELSIEVDLDSPFNVGVIIGSSGSGKTTLAKAIFGNDCFVTAIDEEKAIIDQFPDDYDYDKCSAMLNGIGLNSIPCWLRPIKTLSNGQRARAECALLMCSNNRIIAIDEWTSVVDRTVAKAMSHCVQKFSRKNNKQIILLSCHYDVLSWLRLS